MFFKKVIEDRVVIAKNNEEELNKIIEEYKPFIASVVNKKVGRYVKYGHDDELSIGLLAFKEAIDSYDRKKGKFIPFAKQVISIRLIDYYRKTKKEKNIIYLNIDDELENSEISNIEKEKAILNYEKNEENEIRKLEIIEYSKELKNWNIDFNDLVKASPKQKKLREIYKEVSKVIVNNAEILKELLSKKRLPINKIVQIYDIHRKKLERGRIYIIALVIAQIGDYELIKEYIYGGE